MLPYNDKAMTYDKEKHMYVLNEDYVVNELNIDLTRAVASMGQFAKSKTPERFLIEVSQDIYREIYKYTRIDMKDWKEFLLAKREDWRDVIKEALEYQVAYIVTNGRLSNWSGKNIYKNTSMDLKNSYVHDLAIQVLADNGILYAGGYNVPIDFKKRVDY